MRSRLAKVMPNPSIKRLSGILLEKYKMVSKASKLFAPNQLEIIGVRLIDGTTSAFEHKYSGTKFDKNSIYIFPEGISEKVLRVEDDLILVDSDNNNWRATDVEYNSLP